MPTAPVSTKPDEQRAAERATPDTSRQEDKPAEPAATGAVRTTWPPDPGEEHGKRRAEARGRPASDRDVDSDLLLDVPLLVVEELSLDVQASVLLNSIKLDAKGLEGAVYLKANLDLLRPPARRNVPHAEERGSYQDEGSDTGRVPRALRELIGVTRDAYRELSERTVEQQQPGSSERPALEHRPEHPSGDEEDGRAHAALERARDVAKGGAKAAGLTAAGLAGGAILESRTKASRKLPLPRRRNRAQAIGHEIAKRLP